MTHRTVPFYFGVGSRYSYLAATQLPSIEARTGCKFEWVPLQTGELIRRANGGSSPFQGPSPSGQYVWSFRQQDAEAWAKYYGVPYREPADPGLENADHAHACWIAAQFGKLEEMSLQIMASKFANATDLSREGIRQIAEEIGLDGQYLVAQLDAPEIAEKHLSAVERALAEGVFGVPTFIVDQRLYWGNDRLALVEHALKALNANSG